MFHDKGDFQEIKNISFLHNFIVRPLWLSALHLYMYIHVYTHVHVSICYRLAECRSEDGGEVHGGRGMLGFLTV